MNTTHFMKDTLRYNYIHSSRPSINIFSRSHLALKYFKTLVARYSLKQTGNGFTLCLFWVYVVVNFLFQLIFIFSLFWGMVMYANVKQRKNKN